MFEIHNVYMICALAAIGGGLFGFDISSMSGVLVTDAYTNYFNVNGGTKQGGITCAMPAGSFFGALGSSFLADKLSRRLAIQIAAVIFIMGAILQCAANGLILLIVGRVVAGLGVGICSSVVPVYQAEIAPKEIRGRVVTLQQWAITWGILIQYFVQYGASFTGGGPNNPDQGTAAFRIPWGTQIIPAAILLIGMFFCPRSPRWLASKDEWEEAVRVLAVLHGNGDINHPKVLAEYQEIEEALTLEREEAVTSFIALTKPRMLRRVVLGMSVQMWSQLSGMNVMMYYVAYCMESAGVGNPLLASTINYILNVVCTLPAIIYLDKWGRRPSMLLGSFFMMLFLLIVGALEAVYGHEEYTDDGPLAAISWVMDDNLAASNAAVAFSFLFVCTFAVTWGPTSWTYPSEIFPSQIRAKAVSLATASNWAWNCALAFAVPPLLWNINWKLYIIFAGFNGLAFIHMFLAAPETKGKTLEEMDEVFESGLPAWRNAPVGSRLDRLQKEIEEGNLKVVTPMGNFTSDKKAPASPLASDLSSCTTQTTSGAL